jgi:hypothetical protein
LDKTWAVHFAARRALGLVVSVWMATASLGCGSSNLHVSGGGEANAYVQTFSGEPSDVRLGHVRLKPDSCAGSDLTPVYRPLDADDFVKVLREQKIDVDVTRARADLVFVDAKNVGTAAPIRFRVAVLDTAGAAGHELHEALLEHGEGAWGVHRANLAVLAPNGPADDAVVLAVKTKLACWGVLTIAGHDDTFVIAGGYTEL